MSLPAPANIPTLLSYFGLRKAIGVIGIALPFVLWFGQPLLDQLLGAASGIPSSVSGYYYSPLRDVFVGSLCAIGVFLFSYKGYDKKDAIAGKIASFSALGVALFPTTPDTGVTPLATFIGYVHAFFAAFFFLTLAIFSLVLFRKTDETKAPTWQKLQRNKVYLTCGITILLCLVLIAIIHFLPSGASIWRFYPVFWLETIADVAFGVSWLVKGEAILKDGG